MKQIEKTCKNNIRITFYTGDIDKAIQIHKNICKQLEHAVDEVEEQLGFAVFLQNNVLYSDIDFDSYLVSPKEILQFICNTYTVDISGVGRDFNSGYVTAFELYYDDNKSESIEEHYVAIKSEDTNIETTFPLQNEEIDDVLSIVDMPIELTDDDLII